MTAIEPDAIAQPFGDRREIYPMPSFVTLVVRNVADSVAWYKDVLDFKVVMSFGAPDGVVNFAHLRWVKFADLLLRAGNPAAGAGMTLSYQIELGRIDQWAERAQEVCTRFLSKPGNRPWNTRDFTIADPDGYQICLTAGPVNKTLGMDEIAARITHK